MEQIRAALQLGPGRRRALIAVVVVVAALVVADFFVAHHAAFGLDGTPAFAGWYGLVAAVVAVALALGWAHLGATEGAWRDD